MIAKALDDAAAAALHLGAELLRVVHAGIAQRLAVLRLHDADERADEKSGHEQGSIHGHLVHEESMIPKSGYRFSDKIMPKHQELT